MRTSRLKPISSILFALSAVAFVPVAALAAEPTPSEISIARKLFDDGKAAADAKRFGEAADKFRRALAIKETPGIRYHLAHAEAEQGAYVEALVDYDRARELIEQGVSAPDVEKLLPEAREKVRLKLAHVTLRLPEGVPQVNVLVDGKPVSASALGMPLPLNPGRHRLQASAPGRKAFALELSAATGGTQQIDVELPVDTSPAPAAPSVLAPRASVGASDSAINGRTVALVGEGALFVAALTTGIVFTIKRSAAADRYDDANRLILAQVEDASQVDSACAADLPGCDELVQAQDDRATAGTVAGVAFVAAGVSAAAFGLTYWLWPQGSAPVEVRGAVAPGRLGLSVTGSF